MYDKWTPTDAPGFALADEADFVPLRAPVTSAREIAPKAEQTESLRAEDIRPGMRQIGGEWFYSARWL